MQLKTLLMVLKTNKGTFMVSPTTEKLRTLSHIKQIKWKNALHIVFIYK